MLSLAMIFVALPGILLSIVVIRAFGQLAEMSRRRVADPLFPTMALSSPDPDWAENIPGMVSTSPRPDWVEKVSGIKHVFSERPKFFPGLEIIFAGQSIYPDGVYPGVRRTRRWRDQITSRWAKGPDDSLQGATVLYYDKHITPAGAYCNGRPRWRDPVTGRFIAGPAWSLD
jgi:hypothetical protein